MTPSVSEVKTISMSSEESSPFAEDNVNTVPNTFNVMQLTEFTQSQIKAQAKIFKKDHLIEVLKICPAYHGGPLDYPKVTALCIGQVLYKWDLCFDQLMEKPEPELEERKNHVNPSASIDTSSISEPTTPLEDFISAVEESYNRLLIDSADLIKELLCSGNSASLLSVISGVAFIRNKLWKFNEQIPGDPSPFRNQYMEVSELLESSLAQLVEYQVNLMATTILHDTDSQRWTDGRAFYEDERISHNVQMWWYYLQGLKMDFWTSLPPKAAQSVLANIFEKTLSILTVRYTSISPAEIRRRQFKGDIHSILLISSEVLQWISVSVEQYFDFKSTMTMSNVVIRSIHLKCRMLIETLAVVASPLHVLYKITTDMARSMKPLALTEPEKRISWLNLVRPSLFTSSNPTKIKNEQILALRIKIMTYQPEPIWPSLVQLLLCSEMIVSQNIITNIGQLIPGTNDQLPKTIHQGCEGCFCQNQCIGAADQTWSQAVGSSITRIVLQGMRSQDSLIKLFTPLFAAMNEEGLECLDRAQIWNLKKPIWFQGVCRLLEPHLLIAMDHVLVKIEAKRKLDKAEVRSDIRRTLEDVEDLMDILPVQIFRLSKEIETKAKAGNIRPIADSVLAQLIVSVLYGLVTRIQTSLNQSKASRDKMDYLLAFSEALLNLHEEVKFLQHLQNLATDLTKQNHQNEDVKERNLDGIIGESSFYLAEIIANDLLSDEEGRFALQIMDRFVTYNTDWVLHTLGTMSFEKHGNSVAMLDDEAVPVMPLVRPWGAELYPDTSAVAMMNRIGGSVFDVEETDNQYFLLKPINVANQNKVAEGVCQCIFILVIE